MKRHLLLLCAVFLTLGVARVRAAEVTASLDPAQVAVGDTAQLTVTINGASDAPPAVPNIPGLEIAHVGQSTQAQFVNGVMHVSAVHTYELTPQRAGTFTIPSIAAGGAKSTPLTLRASGTASANAAARAGRPQAAPRSNPALSQPGSSAPQATTPDAPADSRYGFIQLVVPKKQVYVGELVPVEVDAYVPSDMQASVNGLPTLSSDAFTLNPLGDKPDQVEREVNGRDYTVLTWHSALTAVKNGDFSLSMEMPITVVVREQRRQRQRADTGNDLFDQFFNDPFFNDPFQGAVGRQRQVTLGSDPATLTVQALPTANRPADFYGAVGNFQVHATASPTNVAAGDPVTLRLEVTGTGAFDRLGSDGLASGNGWKTYPAKSTFAPDDSAGYRGTQTFEQVAIPRDASVKEIPALRLSFFNPETRRYETRSTPPIPVSVTGAPANLTTAAPAVTTAVNPAATPPPAPDLVPNKVDPGHFVATLRPVFLSPAFAAVPGVPLCALLGGLFFIGRRRRFLADPSLVRASAADRAVRAQLDAMDQATRQRQPTAFFLAARHALQQRLGERWNVRPETITLAEVNSRLNGSAEGIRPVFELADQISYSGQAFGDADYSQWKELVVTQLKALEK